VAGRHTEGHLVGSTVELTLSSLRCDDGPTVD
jgi:hypothetical protein